jgi:hypothetical protein
MCEANVRSIHLSRIGVRNAPINKPTDRLNRDWSIQLSAENWSLWRLYADVVDWNAGGCCGVWVWR